MKNEEEKRPRCANDGCRKPADEGSCFCASCGLEWMLLRRDTRRATDADARGDRISR